MGKSNTSEKTWYILYLDYLNIKNWHMWNNFYGFMVTCLIGVLVSSVPNPYCWYTSEDSIIFSDRIMFLCNNLQCYSKLHLMINNFDLIDTIIDSFLRTTIDFFVTCFWYTVLDFNTCTNIYKHTIIWE